MGRKTDQERIQAEASRVGDRMARSRQRLALNQDPGKVTQLIQERILKDLDKLIEESRQQQAQNGGQQQSGQAQKMNTPKQQGPQADPGNREQVVRKKTGGSTPKPDSRVPGQVESDLDISQQIAETSAEWGKISPRLRDAVIEGSSEQIIEKYRRYVEDYYKGVSQQGTEQRQ